MAKGYVQINVDYGIYRAHRLAWVYMTGENPELGIDHIDRNPANNAWSNLRLATDQQNLTNKAVSPKNKLGLKGVHKIPNRPSCYVAKIKKFGKSYTLGHFKTPEEAKAAYDAAAKVIHGEFFCP